MSVNDVNSADDTDMADCDGEKVVTMMDVLQEQQEFEEDANAVLGASDDKNCTYSKGYIKRQALYACLTCCVEAKMDPSKRAGVCLACSLTCHENHELIELYTKRNFRCDCGNPKFNNHPCQYTPNKNDLNEGNNYNQNFSGVYCICHRPYPDPESTFEDEMIQCIICEDWLHASHLEAKVPANDQYSEMICKACMEKNEFLHDYSGLAVNNESDVDVITVNGSEKGLIVNTTECNGTLSGDKLTENTQTNTNKEDEQDVNMTDIVKDMADEEKDTNINISEAKTETAENVQNNVENSEKIADINMSEAQTKTAENVQNNVENSEGITENMDTDINMSEAKTETAENVQNNVENSERIVENTDTLNVEKDIQESVSSELNSDFNEENAKSAETEIVKPSTNDNENVTENMSETCDKINIISESGCIESNNLNEKMDETSNESEKSVAKDVTNESVTQEKLNDNVNKEEIPQENEDKTCAATVIENVEKEEQETIAENGDKTCATTMLENVAEKEQETIAQEDGDQSCATTVIESVEEKEKETIAQEDEDKTCATTVIENVKEEEQETIAKETDNKHPAESSSIVPENSIKADETATEKVEQIMEISVTDTNQNNDQTDAEKIEQDNETSVTEEAIEIEQKSKPITDTETEENCETSKEETESLTRDTDTEKEQSLVSSVTDEQCTDTVEFSIQPSIISVESLINDDKLSEAATNNESLQELQVNTNNDEQKIESIKENVDSNENLKETVEEADKAEKERNETSKMEKAEFNSLELDEASQKIISCIDDLTEDTKTENMAQNISSNAEDTNEVEMKDITSNHKSEDCENKVPKETQPLTITEENTSDNKRKLLSEETTEVTIKKPKLGDVKPCTRPKNVKKIFKGATFWPSNFRQKLCTCNECITMYKDLSVLFLIDPEDTVTAYEALGKERAQGTPATQYEKGLQALSSLDRIQQINALTEYNKMRDKLLDFLKSFKDRKEIVKEEDIKAFFAGMKPKREPDGVYFCR